MIFGQISRAEPLKDVLDRERDLLVEELISDALADAENKDAMARAIAANPDLARHLSDLQLRRDADAARPEILDSASSEEEALRRLIRDVHYERGFWYGPLWWLYVAQTFTGIAAALGYATGIWSFANYWMDSAILSLAIAIAGWILSMIFAFFLGIDSSFYLGIARIVWPALLSVTSAAAAWYGVYQITNGGLPSILLASGSAALAGLFMSIGHWLYRVEPEIYLRNEAGVIRLQPIASTSLAFEEWRRALREDGVLPFLRRRINELILKDYSVVLSVREAPGLRHMGDLKYHVPTTSRDELIRRSNLVDGGSFALAGPRGAGKTILLKTFCMGGYTADPAHDLGVVVAAPVGYQPRDFVLYLYAEICKATKAYIQRTAAAGRTGSRGGGCRRIPGKLRALLQFRSMAYTWATAPDALTDLARRADEKLNQARYLQSFSTEVSGRLGITVADLNAKAATTLVEQALTYPEIVSDLRNFLEIVATTLRANAGPENGEPPRILIGIDELDRMGSGEQARKFLDDIKAIFWIPGCYFLVSVSEDALRTFELAGHGMRDVFDSSFDEVIRVEHLDFRASTDLLRARVTGMSVPYHALAYCLSGGLPRELMRAARSIAGQYAPNAEVRLGQVTATLVAAELSRHCHAALLALADTQGGAEAVDLVRFLDEGRQGTNRDLGEFAQCAIAVATGCSVEVRALAGTVAAHAHYLAGLEEVFTDHLRQEDMERAADESRPIDVRFETLARARRYLGVNDAFARTLVDTFLRGWKPADPEENAIERDAARAARE